MAKDAKASIQPLSDRVLVKREEKEVTKSAGGIIIPDTATKEKSKIGMVLAVGPGKMSDDGRLIPMTIKPGTKVIFNAGWDNEIDLPAQAGMGEKDEEYFLVKESDILAVIK